MFMTLFLERMGALIDNEKQKNQNLPLIDNEINNSERKEPFFGFQEDISTMIMPIYYFLFRI